MTGCKTAPGGATAVLMKKIDQVWNYTTQAIGATDYYPRTTRIDFSYAARMRRELATQNNESDIVTNANTVLPSARFAYATGPNLFITSANTATIVKLVGIKFLDDLADGATPDIFLTYFTDWLKWATIAALNIHLKDSERFPIDSVLVEGMFQSVRTMDGSIANMGESVDLD
jgi:hypothetical protein